MVSRQAGKQAGWNSPNHHLCCSKLAGHVTDNALPACVQVRVMLLLKRNHPNHPKRLPRFNDLSFYIAQVGAAARPTVHVNMRVRAGCRGQTQGPCTQLHPYVTGAVSGCAHSCPAPASAVAG